MSARTPFVGREAELAALSRRLDEAAGSGRGGALLVAGEPGVGKTRLVLEAAERARADAWLVLLGRAYESEGAPPYLPFADALRDYLRTCPIALLRAQLGDGAGEVGLVLRDLRARLPELAARRPSDGGDRFRLFDALTDFLLAAARAPRARSSQERLRPGAARARTPGGSCARPCPARRGGGAAQRARRAGARRRGTAHRRRVNSAARPTRPPSC
jgi:hypothetical protein